MSNEYTKERTFILVGSLEGEGYLFKTEYGSLVSETMLKEQLTRDFTQATRLFEKLDGTQQIRITMEVGDQK